jgi:hypothetical protein
LSQKQPADRFQNAREPAAILAGLLDADRTSLEANVREVLAVREGLRAQT